MSLPVNKRREEEENEKRGGNERGYETRNKKLKI